MVENTLVGGLAHQMADRDAECSPRVTSQTLLQLSGC